MFVTELLLLAKRFLTAFIIIIIITEIFRVA